MLLAVPNETRLMLNLRSEVTPFMLYSSLGYWSCMMIQDREMEWTELH